MAIQHLENGMVLMTEEEYHDLASHYVTDEDLYGYENAVRIVRDRAKQQIDKATADKHGYTFLKCHERPYNHNSETLAWFITKNTPYSLKLTLKEAKAMIEKDLYEFYSFKKLNFPIKDIFLLFKCKEDRSRVQNQDMLNRLALMDAYDWEIIFQIHEISSNIGQGCYTVSYWATSPL